MNSLKYNAIADFVGRSWSALLSVMLIPVYVSILGIEAYGLIGFSITLQSALSRLDLGLGTAVIRELARLSARDGASQEQRDLVRTLESIYWAGAIFVATIVVLFASWIASSWINGNGLSTKTLAEGVRIMGLIIAFRLPFALYQGGLVGLQRQTVLRAALIGLGTIRGFGAVVVLNWISPTVQAFLMWELFMAALQTGLTRWLLQRSLPSTGQRDCWRLRSLLGVSRFAAGMAAASLFTAVLIQMDKVILSKLLTLESYGCYMLAAALGSVIGMIVGPLQNAAFPRLSQLAQTRDEFSLCSLYHRLCQVIAVATLPTVLVLAFFSRDLLFIWTGDWGVAERSAHVVSFMVIGCGLNALMVMPSRLQLASGWTRLTLYVNAASVVIMVPLLVGLTRYLGAVGGAVSWAVLNASYLLIVPHLMHARLLKTEKVRWYVEDVMVPTVVAAATVGLTWSLTTMYELAGLSMAICLLLTWLVATVFTSLSLPHVREMVLPLFQLRSKHLTCPK